jgi:hypothetical protein
MININKYLVSEFAATISRIDTVVTCAQKSRLKSGPPIY